MPSGPGYNPAIPTGITESEFDYLKAYLNGSHDNNFNRCPGCPSSSGTDTVLRHSIATTTIDNITGGSLSLVVTGIPEAPLIYTTNNSAINVNVVPYNNMPNPTGAYTNYSSDFLKGHGVGRYRCCSLAFKLEDQTPPMYQKGTIMAARNPSAIDIVPFAFAGLGGQTLEYQTTCVRVVETLPLAESNITALSSNVYTGNVKDGLYSPIPYLEPTNPFINRDSPDNKAVYSVGTTPTNVNQAVMNHANVLGVKAGADPLLYLVKSTGTTVSTLVTDGLIPVHPENMQTLAVYAHGMDPVEAVLRLTVVSTWEFVTSSGSDWADLIKPPMRTNFQLLALASEVFRGMPAAYPASANAWNDVWTRFKDVYGKYVSPIAKNLIQNLPPQYAGPAAAVKGLLDTVADAKQDIKQLVTTAAQEVKKASNAAAPSQNGRNGRR